MNKEDLLVIIDLINNSGKESRELKKVKEKATILVERYNLDENYQKSMQDLGQRFQNLESSETDDKDNN